MNCIEPKGRYYEAIVPETLDLAELGKLSINVLTENLEPAHGYGVYQCFSFDNPPKKWGLTWNLPAKNARALPMLRALCGSKQNLDIESDLMRTLLEQIREDGLAYVPIDSEGAPKDTSYPSMNGLLVMAVLDWYERDGSKEWLNYVDMLCKGLRKIAVQVEDRAYYPPESSYKPDGTWAWTLRGEATIPYTPPEEPYLEGQGFEGCVKFEQSAPLRALAKCYRTTKDTENLKLAQSIAHFCLKPGMWEDTSRNGYLGNEHGIFTGHFHGNITALLAMLDLAIVQNDDWMKQFVREAYDHARRTGVIRMGWFPGWVKPEASSRPASLFLAGETCGVSDMLILAVKLTDAGLGDYWDDVDSIVRNHLTAQQFIDVDRMLGMAGGGEAGEELIKRFAGGFGQGDVTDSDPRFWGCCSANGAIGLYYAWHGITRFDNGVAKLNLFLNRASDWMDVDSYLPYEGKVVLHNKSAHTALVRVPYWIDRMQLECFVNGMVVQPTLTGNCLLFDSIRNGTEVRIEFPVPITTEKHTIGETEYTMTFRGTTLVDISPRGNDPDKYQYYLRDHLNGNRAPMHKVTRFIAEKIIPLQ